MENWQKPTAMHVSPRANATGKSLFWKTVYDIVEMDRGAQQGLIAAFMFKPANIANMNGFEKVGYYVGEAAGILGGVITGEAIGRSAAIALNEATFFGGRLGVSELVSRFEPSFLRMETRHQIANISRVSSDLANRPFITEEAIAKGWKPPYPSGLSLRQITTAGEIKFLRFFTGNDPTGRFLVRANDVEHILNDTEQLRLYLGLKEVPASMADVYVPAGTNLLVGRIGPQPNFGLFDRSGFQYQLLDQIPKLRKYDP